MIDLHIHSETSIWLIKSSHNGFTEAAAFTDQRDESFEYHGRLIVRRMTVGSDIMEADLN